MNNALVGNKAIHTLAWFSIESCMIYLLYSGFRKRSDRGAAIAAAVVGAESLVFAAEGVSVSPDVARRAIGGPARFGDGHLSAEVVCPQFAGDPCSPSHPGCVPASRNVRSNQAA
jgi:hypothetical protein